MFTNHAKDRIRERFPQMNFARFDKLLSQIANKIFSVDYIICKYEEDTNVWIVELEIDFPFRLAITEDNRGITVKTVFLTKKERRNLSRRKNIAEIKRNQERYRLIKLEKS